MRRRSRCAGASVNSRSAPGDRKGDPRPETRGGCFITSTGRGKRMSIPTRTWSPDSVIRPNWSRHAVLAGPGTCGDSPGCSLSRWPRSTGTTTAKPVWHCSIRAAPEDRLLSDAEWAQVAAAVMDRTGLAPAGDDRAVRWVAVRHAPDHIHLVATLARQDRIRPKVWNDFFRVRRSLPGGGAAVRPARDRPGGSHRSPARDAGPSRSRRPGVGGRNRRG